MHTTGARTLEGLLPVFDGRREASGRNPPRRERPAWGMGEATLQALEIARTGRRNIHVAGRDDSHPRYRAIAQALLPELDIEATRETTWFLGHLRPRGPTPGQEHPENRNPPDLGPPNPREPRDISHTQISTYR